MIDAMELYTFLELHEEMCQNHTTCEECELSGGKCLCGGWSGGTFEEVERIVLAVERWKAIRGKEIAKRELEEFVAQLAKELKGSMKIDNGALVIERSGAGEIKFKLGGAE